MTGYDTFTFAYEVNGETMTEEVHANGECEAWDLLRHIEPDIYANETVRMVAPEWAAS